MKLLKLRVARNAAEIEGLGLAWNSLMTPELTMFQSYRWNSLAASTFAEREEPYFIFAEDDNGAAILPAVIQLDSRTISFAGETLFDYRDFLAAGDPGAVTAAWKKLASLNLPISVTAIRRSEDRIWQGLPKQFFSRAPRVHKWEITSEQLVESHSRAFSRLRKLERIGLRITQYAGDSPIVPEIYRLRRAQSTPAGLFHDPLRCDFMIATCRAERSNCEVFVLEHGPTLAAALVTFRDCEWRRCYTIFYDHRWARFSPGVSLLFEVTRRSLEQGMNVDLMTGEQPYKMRLAESAQDLFKVVANAVEMREFFPAPALSLAA